MSRQASFRTCCAARCGVGGPLGDGLRMVWDYFELLLDSLEMVWGWFGGGLGLVGEDVSRIPDLVWVDDQQQIDIDEPMVM